MQDLILVDCLELHFKQFDFDTIFQNDFELDLQTISFTPGVEFIFPVRRNWDLKPFANLGGGTEFNGDSSAWIYAAGVRSRAYFPAGKSTLVLSWWISN